MSIHRRAPLVERGMARTQLLATTRYQLPYNPAV